MKVLTSLSAVNVYKYFAHQADVCYCFSYFHFTVDNNTYDSMEQTQS